MELPLWRNEAPLLPYGDIRPRDLIGAPGPSAVECMRGRCSLSFERCYNTSECRLGWAQVSPALQGMGINASLLRAKLDRQGLPALDRMARCFLRRCTCSTLASPLSSHYESAVELVRGAVAAAEVDAIVRLGEALGGSSRRAFGDSLQVSVGRGAHVLVPPAGHTVTFLHSRFVRRFPALYARLRGHVLRSDTAHGWNLLDGTRLEPRTIELLEYSRTADSVRAAEPPQSRALTAWAVTARTSGKRVGVGMCRPLHELGALTGWPRLMLRPPHRRPIAPCPAYCSSGGTSTSSLP